MASARHIHRKPPDGVNKRAYFYDGKFVDTEFLTNLLDCTDNYLSQLIKKYNGNVQLAIDAKLGKANFD